MTIITDRCSCVLSNGWGGESTLADHLSLSLSLFFLLLYTGSYLIWRTAIHRLKACVVMETVSRCATSQLPPVRRLDCSMLCCVARLRTEPSRTRRSEWGCECVIHNFDRICSEFKNFMKSFPKIIFSTFLYWFKRFAEMRNATHSRDGTRHRHVKSNKLSFRFKNKIIFSPETQNDQGLFPALQETFFIFIFFKWSGNVQQYNSWNY